MCVVAAVVVAGVTYLSTGSSPQFPVVYAPTTPRTNPRDRSPENVVSVRPYSLFDTLLTPDVFFLCVYCRVDRAWFAIRVYYSARHPLSLCRYFRCVLYAYGRLAGLILVFSLFSLSLSLIISEVGWYCRRSVPLLRTGSHPPRKHLRILLHDTRNSSTCISETKPSMYHAYEEHLNGMPVWQRNQVYITSATASSGLIWCELSECVSLLQRS